MKLKTLAMAICSVVCVGVVWAGVDTATEYVSASEATVDISAGVTISGWQDSAELKQLTISFDKNVLSDFNYSAMDTEEYSYILEYLCFNGKTVKEINADTSLNAVSWTYTQFPGNANDKYKVPVLVYERDEARLRLFIHENYFAMLGENCTFEMKEGLTFVNGGTTYAMDETRRFVYSNGAWAAAKQETDITANVTINGWNTTGNASELTYTLINFGAGVLPGDLGYHILDSDIGTHYHYIKDYITVNGKTVGEINAQTDISNYVFSSFPSTAADKYKLPIILFGNGGNLEVKIHNDYIASLGVSTPIVIGVKSGLYFDGVSARYNVTSDVTAMVRVAAEMDITANVSINGWDTTGSASELTYTRIKLGEGVMPEGVGYGIIDADAWKYMQEYITINGKTVADINANTDDASYVYSTFPSTADVKYQVPVMIYVNNGTLEVKVHNDYIATLGAYTEIVIGVKAGLSVVGGGTTYKVNEDVSVTVREKIICEDITASVSINGWDTTGSASELTYTRINLGKGVMPEGVGYGIIDADAWKYIQEYITINGRTVADINANTDDASYVYSTFPSTADEKYQIPVMIYVNDDTLEVKVHNDYIATLGDNIDIIIGVKAGLSVKDGSTVYTVTEDVATYAKRKKYTLTVELASGTENEFYLTMGSVIDLGAPEKEHYTFEGWFEKGTDNAALTTMPERDYAVYAKYAAIEYTVTFKVDGVQVGETQTYTVENKTIVEPTIPAKEHYTAAWTSYGLNGGNVTVEAIYTAIEYTVTFMDGETVIGTATYTIENTEITEPAVPTKEGYASVWAAYTLTGGDVTVEVIYTLIDDGSSDEDDSAEDSSDAITSEDSAANDNEASDNETDNNSSENGESNATSNENDASSGVGCYGAVDGLSVGIALVGLFTVVLLKKKENE